MGVVGGDAEGGLGVGRVGRVARFRRRGGGCFLWVRWRRVGVVGVLGRLGGGGGVVGVGGVGGAVEAADAGGSFVAVGAHVGVGGFFAGLFLGGAALAAFRGRGGLGEGDLGGGGRVADDAAAAEVGGFGRAGEGGAVGAFAPEDGRFIFGPVAAAEDAAAVFGPEEEPDAGEDDADREEGEEEEDAFVVDGHRGDAAGAGVEGHEWGGGFFVEEVVEFVGGDIEGSCGAFEEGG